MRHLQTSLQLVSVLYIRNSFNFVDFKPDTSIRTGKNVKRLYAKFLGAVKEYDEARADLDDSALKKARTEIDFTYNLATDMHAQTCKKLQDPELPCSKQFAFMTQQKWARMPVPTCVTGVTTPYDDQTIQNDVNALREAERSCVIL